jgi:hypothetical protein
MAVLLLPACAWTNRANRPVWNAFEEHLVPEHDTWFWVALPLTVPAGFLAIATDTLIVHPIQVVDDAAGDAADLWTKDGPDFQERYYTELAFLPLRTALTPVVFGFSFLGRSLFDIRTDRSGETPKEETISLEEIERISHEQLLRWFQEVAAGGSEPFGSPTTLVEPSSEELRAALQEARASGSSPQRLAIYVLAQRSGWSPEVLDPRRGLQDPDPVVRYELLRRIDRELAIDDDLREALCNDPNEVVRAAAQRRWRK